MIADATNEKQWLLVTIETKMLPLTTEMLGPAKHKAGRRLDQKDTPLDAVLLTPATIHKTCWAQYSQGTPSPPISFFSHAAAARLILPNMV